MPRSRTLNESSGGKPRNRKPKTLTSSPSCSQQKNLSDAFKRSQTTTESGTVLEESSSKRVKLNHSPAPESSKPANINEMYNFSRPNHVDLTNGNGPATMTKVQKTPLGAAKPPGTLTETGPKKLVVKNLRKTPKSDPEKYINHVLSQLDTALSAILVGEEIPHSNEELYRGVENLCRQGRAAPLFRTLCEKCNQGISSQLQEPLVAKASTLDDVGILSAVIEAWDIWNLRLTDDTLRKAIKIFHSMSVYTSYFEPEFLARSSSYIASWSDQKAESLDLAQYIHESRDLINLELARCHVLGLDSSTEKTLKTYLVDLLVDQEDRQKKLLNTVDICRLLHEDQRDSTRDPLWDPLRDLYNLLDMRGLCEKLRIPFETYIGEAGSQIVFDEEREHEMVPRLLNFKKKLDLILQEPFFEDEGLGHSLREAFEAFINKSKRSNMTWGTDNPKPGEMIAKHVDMILKGGMRGVTNSTAAARHDNNEVVDVPSEDEDVEINKQLDQVLELFRVVHGKAVFEAFYKRDLARRLLLNRSASADAEKSMLTRLKSECGAGFTHNLEQMFKDMELAREEVTSYKSILDERDSRPSIDLNVSVLSASAWPSYPDVPLIVPRDVQQAVTIFEQHYKVKHSGRKLEWKHSLAHCQLKAIFPKGNKELVVSSYQAVVLLLFSNKSANDEVPYIQLQAATGLDDVELKRTLQSLACAKYRVLSKTPRGRDVNPDDTFYVNMNFSDPKYRIKINQVQAKETKEENKETHERVAADRVFETQAAIVRIMKGRKTITHQELMSEVISATKSRGPLDPAEIKKNIEK
ncbi:MAG: hypothetical protein Q9166_000586 [cf. Caloplaca sp. 2 TL-2023]